MAGILYTSSLGAAITPVSGVAQTLVAKLGHAVEYAVLGGLLLRGVVRETGGVPMRRAVLAAVVLGTAFAGFDELRQSFSPGREPRLTDVIIDALSVLVGALGVSRLARASAPPPAAESP